MVGPKSITELLAGRLLLVRERHTPGALQPFELWRVMLLLSHTVSYCEFWNLQAPLSSKERCMRGNLPTAAIYIGVRSLNRTCALAFKSICFLHGVPDRRRFLFHLGTCFHQCQGSPSYFPAYFTAWLRSNRHIPWRKCKVCRMLMGGVYGLQNYWPLQSITQIPFIPPPCGESISAFSLLATVHMNTVLSVIITMHIWLPKLVTLLAACLFLWPTLPFSSQLQPVTTITTALSVSLSLNVMDYTYKHSHKEFMVIF